MSNQKPLAPSDVEDEGSLVQCRLHWSENWSSDGDSVSSSASSSTPDRASSTDEEGRLHEHQTQKHQDKTQLSLLKRGCVFTDAEVMDQAIDRWEAYIQTCSQALGVLRQEMVDAYIPYALEQHRASIHPTGKQTSASLIDGDVPVGRRTGRSSGDRASWTAQRQWALQKMLRHSVKIANQRNLTCVSKFAICNNRLAKWRRPTITAAQRCQFRDPTTTTWEKPCTHPCVPLLSVCANHLVQIKPAAPRTPTTPTTSVVPKPSQSPLATLPSSDSPTLFASETPNTMANTTPLTSSSSATSFCAFPNQLMDCSYEAGDMAPGLGLLSLPPAKNTRSVRGSTSDGSLITLGTSMTNTTPSMLLPTQYLFRRCGGGWSGGGVKSCEEPVIGWNEASRCPRHTNAACIPEAMWSHPTDSNPHPSSSCSIISSQLYAALMPIDKMESRDDDGTDQ